MKHKKKYIHGIKKIRVAVMYNIKYTSNALCEVKVTHQWNVQYVISDYCFLQQTCDTKY
jgi:hypothetical protein